jgi:ligand-binding SRPBCC domain-containing protein
VAASPVRDGVIYRLYRRQVVGGSVPAVFGFFKDPRNLEAITPPWLGFRILEATAREVQLGTRIPYRLRLHGMPLRWESLISEYVEGELFADEQITGPYRRWYHRHLFREVSDGVAIEDIVCYQLPFGLLGRLAHAMFVRRQLRVIFDYRAERIAQFFPNHTILPDHQEVTP